MFVLTYVVAQFGRKLESDVCTSDLGSNLNSQRVDEVRLWVLPPLHERG